MSLTVAERLARHSSGALRSSAARARPRRVDGRAGVGAKLNHGQACSVAPTYVDRAGRGTPRFPHDWLVRPEAVTRQEFVRLGLLP